jgi:hypothetical protein
MISIGGQYNGPELSNARIKQLLTATMKAVVKERGPIVGDDDFGPCGERPESGPYFEIGSAPAVNVVFYVPGSLGREGPDKIAAARFSHKQKELLVAVPVPLEMVESEAAAEFVINALRQANRIAAETFARKGTEPFDLEQADAIVDKVKQSLAGQKFS